jgi:hypothetical protein
VQHTDILVIGGATSLSVLSAGPSTAAEGHGTCAPAGAAGHLITLLTIDVVRDIHDDATLAG